MRRVILDTDLFSECIKGKDKLVGKRHDAYVAVHGRLSITSWTVFEVLSGIHHKLPEKLGFYERLLLEADEILPNADDFRMAARIEGALLKVGKPVGPIDPFIAACAVTRSLPVATGNTKHYLPVVKVGFNLELENWRQK
ncbi:MAG: PIN domain-containing protein [Fimbriimonas sp.]|nr:PIN domain-containing protein [Fimbriimonas sp.]